MGWHGPRGSCGCCELDCEECNPVTTVAVNIPEIDCDGDLETRPPMCTRNNGTYVFRTSFTDLGNCIWQYFLLGEGCIIDGGQSFYAQPNAGCTPTGNYFYLQFLRSGGQVVVRFTIVRSYYTVSDGSQSEYNFVFEDTFDTCADAIGATLPFASKTTYDCPGSPGSTGDICFIEANAVVTLG